MSDTSSSSSDENEASNFINELESEMMPLLRSSSGRNNDNPSNRDMVAARNRIELLHALQQLVNEIDDDNHEVQERDVENNLPSDDDPFEQENRLRNSIGNNSLSIASIETIEHMIHAIPFFIFILIAVIIRNWNFVVYFISLYYIPTLEYKKFISEVGKNKEVDRKIMLRSIAIISLLLLCTVYVFNFFSWYDQIFQSVKLNKNTLFDVLQRVILLDAFLQDICLVIKIIVSIFPLSIFHVHSINNKRRQLYSIIEHVFFTYRLATSTITWECYFQRDLYFLFLPYIAIKGGIIGTEFVRVFRMIRLMYKSSMLYGKYVDVNTLQDTTCSVCMDKLINPIQLSCGHLFCEDCISQWFEKETTCPLCRKVIKKGSSWIHSDGSRICSILWY